LRNRTTELFTSIKTKTSKIFEDIVSGAKKLPGRIGDGIRSMAGKVKDGVSAVGKKLAGGLESVMNTITQKGINVVLDKIGVSKKNQIPALNIPGYATGTDFHPGGWAILGDGGKQELLRTPDGRMALSPDTDTLMNLPRGTQVLSGEQTQEFMSMFPAYKKGTGVKDVAKTAGKWLKDTGSKALEKAGEAKGKVSDSIGDIWSYMSDPKKLMNKVFSSLNLKMPDVGGIMGQLAKASVTKVKDGAANFIKKMFGDFGASVAAPAGKGVARWRPVILKAAAVMKESVSDAEVNGILKQIQRESGGNEKIVQSSAVWDVNTAAGNPARGLKIVYVKLGELLETP
jgi:phage-related protein